MATKIPAPAKLSVEIIFRSGETISLVALENDQPFIGGTFCVKDEDGSTKSWPVDTIAGIRCSPMTSSGRAKKKAGPSDIEQAVLAERERLIVWIEEQHAAGRIQTVAQLIRIVRQTAPSK